MDEDIQNTQLFGVPIYRKRFALFFERQAAIVNSVLKLRDGDEGLVRSNARGWHSSEDLHLSADDDLAWLMARLKEVSIDCIEGFEAGRAHGEAHILAAWANVNEYGAWNMPHMHLPAQWSGVFYVTMGDDPEVAEDQEGGILFFDPLPLGEIFKRPPYVAMSPQAGTMLLFPAYVNHMVAPYYGEAPRISIAFNLAVEYSR